MTDQTARPAASVGASRAPPPMVAPVVIDGIRYVQTTGSANDGQVAGWLGAFDASGTQLWSLKVYDRPRRDNIEGDVQDVYFRSMTAEPDGSLTIEDESGARYSVDVKARRVTVLPGAAQSGRAGLLVPD